MGPVRVLGRIDLAEQVYELLRSAGVEARLYTGAPMVAAKAPALEGTELDVIVGGGVAPALIKRAAPGRPVVALDHPALQGDLERAARTRSGPDAWAAWPATVEVILDACRRAAEQAGRPRPRFTLLDLIWIWLSVTSLVALATGLVSQPAASARGLVDQGARFVQVLLWASAAFFSWKRRAAATYYRLGAWLCLAMALGSLWLVGRGLRLW